MGTIDLFQNHTNYIEFRNSSGFSAPNVSVCVNENEVHYNPIVIDPHEYVDLGLPSGTLWATENIKDGNGNELFFAWGEVSGYTSGQVGTDKNFNWSDYKFGTEDNQTKYNDTDGKTVLETADDAATANWGSKWKMPTKEQFEELTANTTTAWTQVDGINGLLCTSTANGNTLFFPGVGYAENGRVYSVGSYGRCWFNSLYDYTFAGGVLSFEGHRCGVGGNDRSSGYSVRPVHI